MGNHRKLRSSAKILQEALTSFTPSAAGPFCIQPAKTHSSRDLVTGFRSFHCTLPSSAASFSDPSSHSNPFRRPQSRGVVEEVATSISAAKSSTSTRSNCPSSSSSSSLPPVAVGGADDPADTEAFPSGTINSRRFFFSPCSSKCITTQAGGGVGFDEMERLGCHTRPGREEENVKVFDRLAEAETETVGEDSTRAETTAVFRDSTPVAMASRDPYGDFRRSMEEMVTAHGLRDWPSLRELLHCYLRLNEQKTHGFIVLAFVDLLMHFPSAHADGHQTS